ncbi:DNA-binding protein [Streptomyces oceani]|uniref:DNA-binding protein n=1 Tax=Streptomyces oceani TaxID=1075402 RepID=A0A1E7KKL4_9ACTN|nr:DNA-binding protein [Streptomyces oceani]
MMTGKMLRFDEVRGYGFIVPDDGNEDVFVHANDLLEEKYLYQPGRAVQFYVEMGDKGPKASEVGFVGEVPNGPSPASVPHRAPQEEPAARPPQQALDDTLCDVLSTAELSAELTEALLEADGTLTGDQIRRVRGRLLKLAQAHSWTDS